MTGKERKTFDPELIRNISERVCRIKLNHSSGGGPGAVERMIAKDEDNGEKLRNRAGAYDPITRAYLEALGYTPDNPPK